MKVIDIEKSIIKKYRKTIWAKFIDAINEFKMINEGDIIGVCISGGKDSFLLAKCMQEIKKHGKVNFELKFIVMNPGYNAKNFDLIMKNAQNLNIPIHIFESNIFDNVENIDNPCYLCARMRRGYLYSEAKKLGCNKIALGHHFDDVIETIMLNMLYSGEFKCMMPKLHSSNFEGMELIRPLYYVREENIIDWVKYSELSFLNCACKFTEKSNKEDISKRKEIKQLIKELRSKSPYIENNIYKCSTCANIDALIGYKKDGIKHSFMEEYDNEL